MVWPFKRSLLGSAVQNAVNAVAAVPAKRPHKTGEQTAKLTDPHGKRIYHEVFVGEIREDEHYPWKARVYHRDGVFEKDGAALTREAAAAQAQNFAKAKRDHLEQQP